MFQLRSALCSLALTLVAASAACFPQLPDLPDGVDDLEVADGDTFTDGEVGSSEDVALPVGDTAPVEVDTSVALDATTPTDATSDAPLRGEDGPVVGQTSPRWAVDKVGVCSEEPLPTAGFNYDCAPQATFTTDDAVFVLLSLADLDAETLRFGADFFHEGHLAWSWADVFHDVSGWDKASTWPTGSGLAPGAWTVDLLVDCGDGFELAATVSFTVQGP